MMRSWKYTPSRLDSPATAVFQCPHCLALSLHKFVGSDVQYSKREDITLTLPEGNYARSEWRDRPVPCTVKYGHWIMRCVNCEMDTYLLVKADAVSVPGVKISPDEANWLRYINLVVHQYPIANPTLHESVPAPISSAAIEAEKCFAVGAYNACGVMTRRAVHSLCEDKGAEGRDLFAQLKDLKTKQLITPDLYEWADSLRVLGRDGAHPEFPEVTADDAEDGVKLLREIVKYVYILPHERAEKRRKV